MAINVYCGLPGSGKSFEVVSEVVAKQVAAGRRIVTNIDGLNPEEVADYAVDKLGADPSALGSVLVVKDPDVESATFLPGEDPTVSTTVRRGDIVVIDEAWRFWGTGEKLLPEHLNFFRMHRHYADAVTGNTCDLVLMTQDISDLHRSLKRVVEFSARCKKHKWAGLNKRYVVNTWEGPKQTVTPAAVFQKHYDPAVFPLYKSYSGGAGREGQLDKRQVTVNGKFKAMMALAFIGLPISMGFVFWKVLHLGGSARHLAPLAAASAPSDEAFDPSVPTAVTRARMEGRRVSMIGEGRAISSPAGPLPSKTWRLAGFVSVGDRRYVLLADGSGRLKDEAALGFRWIDGRPQEGVVDREVVAAFTGTIPGVASAPASSSSAPPSLLPPALRPPGSAVIPAAARGPVL